VQIIQQETIASASPNIESVPGDLDLLRSRLVVDHIVTNDSKGHRFFLSS
jgi:hypothetical protein